MPSAQVAMTAPSGNVCERGDARPSALGHFLSKLSGGKNRHKTPTMTISLKGQTNTSSPTTTATNGSTTQIRIADQNKKALMFDEVNTADVAITRTPNAGKPKRNLSPFARVMNRLSMSRKHTTSTSSEHVQDIGRETLQSIMRTPISSSAKSPTCTTSPRPAISENDLRHITLRRGQVPLSEITPLLGANPFRSEDNLAGSTMRTPSYLRVSCALNGYRQYRRFDLNATPLRTPSTALPLSNVQRRTLQFSSPESASVNTSDLPAQQSELNAEMSTPTPVRQLVARFDNLHLSSDEKSTSEKENNDDELDKQHLHDKTSKNDENAHLTEQCDTLHHPVTPKSSVPLTSQIPYKVLSHPVPEPQLAQSVHSILQQTTVTEAKPHPKNQSEVVISDLKPNETEVAERVLNEQKTMLELHSGEDYQKIFDKTRINLEKKTALAMDILQKHENELPEHAAGTIRLATGKANLFLRNKMHYFAELLNKNLNPIENDPQPAKLDDVASYWELVSMELGNIERLFDEIDELRKNNWQTATTSDEQPSTYTSSTSTTKSNVSKPTMTNRTTTIKNGNVTARGGVGADNGELKKAAEAKRRRDLMEAIRKQKERMLREKNATTPTTIAGDQQQCIKHFVC